MNSAGSNWPETKAGDSFKASLNDSGSALVLLQSGEASEPASLDQTLLQDAGPVLASPAATLTLGTWLYELLQRPLASSSWQAFDTSGGLWRISTEGSTATIQLELTEFRSKASMFRHDARNLLNGIGMNADLIGMHARASDNESIAEAAKRIQSGARNLGDLINTRCGDADMPDVSLASEVRAALARLNTDLTIASPEANNERVPSALSAAIARLTTDWLLWHLSADCSDWGAVEGKRPEFAIRDRQAILELTIGSANGEERGASRSPGSSQLPSCGPADLESMAMLRELGAGFGMWRERNKLGLCIGLAST